MAIKLVFLSVFLVACNAGPVWINGEDYFPGVILRIGRSPNMAFGFGSSYSSNIGGIGHLTSASSSYQSGDTEDYGAGTTGDSVNTKRIGGNDYVRGLSMAHANAAPMFYSTPLSYQRSSAAAHNNGYGRNVNSAVSKAQSYGDYSSADSSAQNFNGYGSVVSATRNAVAPRYQTAIASAKNLGGLGYSAFNGLGYNAAVSSAHSSGGDYGTAMSSARSVNDLEYNAAVSAAENMDGYGGSSSQTIQQRAGVVQNSGASSINGPGLQAVQAHAVNADLY